MFSSHFLFPTSTPSLHLKGWKQKPRFNEKIDSKRTLKLITTDYLDISFAHNVLMRFSIVVKTRMKRNGRIFSTIYPYLIRNNIRSAAVEFWNHYGNRRHCLKTWFPSVLNQFYNKFMFQIFQMFESHIC